MKPSKMKYPSGTIFRNQLSKILWITIGWTIVSVLNFLNGYGTLRALDYELPGGQFGLYLQASILTGIIAGLIGGSVTVFLWERWLRAKHYGLALFNIFWSFTITFYFVSVLVNVYVFKVQLGLPIFDKEIWKRVWENQIGTNNIQGYLFWLFLVLATLIILQVNDKYGPGMFLAFLKGKYFHPKREERIFMFLDLRSSTTIAERLGEERYFHFIRNIFKDATPAILNHKGQIYQYVGDEIVISWTMKDGIENANCLNCFFEIRKELTKKAAYYQENFGMVPEMKAGLHYGHVMAGEMGIVKRDIAFSGDVLNTTSRIQEKCNELGVDVLLSKFLLNKLTLPSHLFKPKEIGDLLLRGKRQKVVLYTMSY